MRAFTIASVAAALVASVSAHMEMTSPPPLRSKANKNAGQNIDYSMTSPLEADGSNFPCKGYLDDTEGKESVATWQAGSSQQITIAGQANHGGGSCQLSISEDEGKTFKVIKSFEGACPASKGDNTLNVDIPTDVKNGDVVFAWTWNNEIGNREFYMNCAMVTIENGGSGLDSYPDMFVAQLSSINSCTIAEGIDVKYPNPGDQVEVADDDSKLGDPTGDCGATGSSSGGSSGGSWCLRCRWLVRHWRCVCHRRRVRRRRLCRPVRQRGRDPLRLHDHLERLRLRHLAEHGQHRRGHEVRQRVDGARQRLCRLVLPGRQRARPPRSALLRLAQAPLEEPPPRL
ncbi:hypothetical protein FB107DRAFT_265103, partial [Schizophyllum commune]